MRDKKTTHLGRVVEAFDHTALKRVCEMHETEFAAAYDMDVTVTPPRKWGNDGYPDFYAFKDNGAKVLAVAHLDTVMPHDERTANYVNTADGPVVFSGALDDRLGAYTILELLPRLGVQVDVLLTTAEESCESTAQFFESSKDYHWMIEFDRGGTDVVMYQYEDVETRGLVQDSGAKPADGIFSDIAYLEHLEVKGFNWGVGYRDYHGPRSHAFLADYWEMIGYYLNFHADNEDTYLPHEHQPVWGGSRRATIYDDDECAGWCGRVGAELDGYGLCPDCAATVDEEQLGHDDDLVSDDFNLVNDRLLADNSGLWA